jgi:hypothetical protein
MGRLPRIFAKSANASLTDIEHRAMFNTQSADEHGPGIHALSGDVRALCMCGHEFVRLRLGVYTHIQDNSSVDPAGLEAIEDVID